jgi:transcriptional regulator with XRE-family HTH domain
MSDEERILELRRFLKSRRARLTPAEVGLPLTGRRRVHGLRREEVASLAGIGVSWYTALENGEDRNFSEATVLAVADALRLNESEREYLVSLVCRPVRTERVEPPGRVILAAMNGNVLPSYVITAEWDILACNEAFRRVWGIAESELPFNALERLFIHPSAREMHGKDFAANVAPLIAMVRSGLARLPDLAGLQRLRDRLLANEELRQIWDEFEVSDPLIPTTCTITSPIGRFCYEALTLPITEKLLAIVVQVPDAASEERLAKALARAPRTRRP